MKKKYHHFRNRLILILKESKRPLTSEELLNLDNGRNIPETPNALSNILRGDDRFEKVKIEVNYGLSNSHGKINAWRLK